MRTTAAHLIRLVFILSLSIAHTLSASARAHETGFLNRTVTVSGVAYRYQVYVPADWTKNKKWPVILFLHGAGERGDDGLIQTEVGLGTAIRRHPDRFPSIVILPQCRKNVWWSDPAMEAQLLQALDKTVKEFNGDPQRIYLTGLSMGGFGTWYLAAKYPGKFAALAPVCGGVRPGADTAADPYAMTAQKVGKTPTWVFHGDADKAVPVAQSRKMVEALKAAGGNVRYREYEGIGHNSWDKAYAEPEFLPWLLAQRLGHPTASAP